MIYHGDCLEVMPEIDDKSIDLIIIDPPYNIGKDSWDKIDNYLEFMQFVFLECQRILKDNGSFYWFHNQMPIIARLMIWLETTEFVFKQMITIGKNNNSYIKDLYGKQEHFRNYIGINEYILFYTFQDETGLTTVMLDNRNFVSLRQYFKNEQKRLNISYKEINNALGTSDSGGGMASHYFNLDKLQWTLPTKKMYEKLQSSFDGFHRSYESLRQEYESLRQEYESLRQEYESLRYTFNGKKGTTNNWTYKFEKVKGHLTPKPIELIENIILHSSNENDLILDCFAGSGTTGIAARNLNRDFILIEKELEYVKLIEKRLSEPTQIRLT